MYSQIVHEEGQEKAAQELNWFSNDQFVFVTDVSTSALGIM